MTRDLMFRGVSLNDEGAPVFTFTCDCAVTTDLTVEGLLSHGAAGTTELAYTCDCGAHHWLTIERRSTWIDTGSGPGYAPK
jgi:hypothetical protein